MKTVGDEDVNGIIIGGEYESGRLFYAGRPQSQRVWENTVKKVIEKLNTRGQEIKAECGPAYKLIYPDNNAWEIRLDT